MSKQIAVRLPDEMVEFVDQLVSEGAASSRAAVVVKALEREHRREIALRDAEILARTEPDADLDGLARHAASVLLDDIA